MRARGAPATLAELRWLGACLALALAPHVRHLPVWISLATAGFVAARLSLAARRRPPPAQRWRLTLAALAIGLLLAEYRTVNGLAAGTALLALVGGLKFFETQTRRDLYVLSFIVYFLSAAALLQSESFGLLIYVVALAWLAMAALLHLTPADPLALLPAARRAGRILAQGLPIAVLMWLFFPRFDGPLWHVDAGRGAETGLSDTLSPGDISELALSDEIAFRVRFLGPTPPLTARYWRGPVLHEFDGKTWRGMEAAEIPAPTRPPSGALYRYRLSLEPHAHRWIFALEWPITWSLGQAALSRDGVLLAPQALSEPLDLLATSSTDAQDIGTLDIAERRRETALPRDRNPRTLALARALRAAHPDALEYAQAILARFHDEPYYYTLTPPRLDEDSIDGFLFDTRRGFCGHYASAFATLMRAGGIPARIVTGYVGGTYNRFAGYWIVRQSQAHAWTEIWLEGRGWSRIDPTRAVAPERIERGLSDRATADDPVGIPRPRYRWLNDLRLELDALQVLWRERVLRYNPRVQAALLRALHVPEPDAQKLVLLLGASLTLALAWLTWQVRRETRPADDDPVLRGYARICRKLAAVGLARRSYEGPLAYGARVAALRPDLAGALEDLCGRYAQLRYGRPDVASDEARDAFLLQVRKFRPAPSSRAARTLRPRDPGGVAPDL